MNKSAEECLRTTYWEMLHNVSLFAPIYGSVDIFQGLPFYCNGQQLLIIGYSIDDSRASVEKRTSDLIAKMWRESECTLQLIEFWGPTLVDISVHHDLTRILEQPASRSNCDVVLSLREFTRAGLRERRDVKRAIRNGLRVEICERKEITYNHINIFDKFLAQHGSIDLEDRKYVEFWQTSIQASDSILFNIYSGDRLTGFAVLSLFGLRVATYAYGFFDNGFAGTSDLAHAAMLNFCIDHSFEQLDLGYSIHDQLLRYKLKWGNATLVAPPWCIRWLADERRLSPHYCSVVGKSSVDYFTDRKPGSNLAPNRCTSHEH